MDNNQEKKKFMLDFPDGSNKIDSTTKDKAINWALKNPGAKLFEITEKKGAVFVDLN